MYLEKINSPDDLKKLELKKLDILADEIREFLIQSVAKTGGHLASNLGVVDLTIALHYCFNCPKDKIVWDVGHQAYTHKILTGRKDEFDTLRKMDGLSGFPKCGESPYDSFNTGHSSTSISAAIGLAEARDLRGENFNVISVIGDGSMTGGLVYEAMNNAGRNNTKLLTILNDNQMSISENVGAMSKYFSELRTAQKYLEAKSDIKKTLEHLPVLGQPVFNVLDKAKESFKYAVTTNSNVMFEQLGITYIGPIDGHDIKKLVHVLNKVKKINKPVLLHIITQKGKGYEHAEAQPSKFHGIGSFDVATGNSVKKNNELTYSELFGKTMSRLATRNKRLCAITAAMPSGTGLDVFKKLYPERTFDVGIAEAHAVTFAAGLAKGGCIPVFAVYSTFLQRGYDQIIHDVCLQNLHVIFAIDRAGIVGDDGETHQGIYDISFLSHIPNMTLMAPKNGTELAKMLEFAVEYRGPIAIRYPRGVISTVLNSIDTPIEYGKCEIIYKGKDIAIISVGAMMDNAIKVYEKLIAAGLSPTLINARFVKPIDDELIEDLKMNYKYVFSMEDNIHSGGFGSMLLQKMEEGCRNNTLIYDFSFPDTYVEQGTREQLFEKYNLDVKSMSDKILEIIKK